MSRLGRIVLGVTLWSLAVLPAASQPAVTRGRLPAPAVTAPGSPDREAQLIAFVQRWSGYVQQVYRIAPAVWRERFAPQFLRADADNVAAAMARDAFDEALASLRGTGFHASRAGRFPDVGLTADALPLPRLDSVGRDLTYTPVTPCRIVDTRLAGGLIPSFSALAFKAMPAGGSYTAQGGSASDCGLTGQAPAAVVLNVTVVAPNIGGFATIYPFNTARPVAASLNYTPGAIVNNSIVVAIPDPPAASDFSIYTIAAAHYVVDIVGYFDNAIATPLACVDTSSSVDVLHQTVAVGTPTACPAGYTSMALFCSFPSNELRLVSRGPDSCTMRNESIATDYNVALSRRCCRVPGR